MPPKKVCVERAYVATTMMPSRYANASIFSFLPAQREKSCVTGLYFLPQNKKVNTDETAATHRTFLSLLLLVFFTSKCI